MQKGWPDIRTNSCGRKTPSEIETIHVIFKEEKTKE